MGSSSSTLRKQKQGRGGYHNRPPDGWGPINGGGGGYYGQQGYARPFNATTTAAPFMNAGVMMGGVAMPPQYYQAGMPVWGYQQQRPQMHIPMRGGGVYPVAGCEF